MLTFSGSDKTAGNELHLLQTVIEESPVAMVLFEGDQFVIRLINKAMLDIWQKDKEVINQSFYKLNILQLSQHLNAVFTSEKTLNLFNQRIEVTVADEVQSCYLDLNFKPLKDDTGKTCCVLCTAYDVSAHIKTQSEANSQEFLSEENDRKFYTLIDRAPVAVGTLRGWDMVIMSANKFLLDFWQKDKSIIGLPLLEALPEVKEHFFMDTLRNVYQTGEPYYGYEIPSQIYRDQYKREFYYNIVYQPIIETNNTVSEILIVAHDVTAQVKAKLELEESKNQLKSLILEAPMPTAIYVGREMLIEVINESMLKHWGKDQTVVGKPLREVLPELDNHFFQLLDQVFTTGNTYHSNETRADLWIDGKMQTGYFNFTYKPLLDSDGKVYGIINMSVDVTSQVHTRLELEKLSRKKDEFLSVASHELKTPLTSLKASMQLINKLFSADPSSAVIKVFMHKANSSISKILRLIDDLMHVSKTQHGLLPLNKTRFKLWELVYDCCDHVRAESAYELVFEGDEELSVFADHARIDQVVVNLVNNAVKYSPGSKKIILRVEKVENKAKVTIQDFGIGIPEEKQKHLFERYYRVDYSGIQFSGLGLGLYIVAEIIERHGGKIGVNSKVGAGSTFWFTLPL